MTSRMSPALPDWLAWGATRLFLLGIVAGVIPWAEQVNDLDIYRDWVVGSLASGRFPTDQMWQYPPLAGPVFVLAEAMPGGRVGFALLFASFDAAIMGMLTAQANRTGRGAGRRLWAWVPLVTGPLLLARFDVVPTALAVAAVLTTARPARSAALAMIGAWLKVWPVLMLAGVARKDLPRAAVAALATSAVILAAMFAFAEQPLSFLSGQAGRGLQIEAVGSLPFLLYRMAGGELAVAYQFGAHELVGRGVAAVASGLAVSSLLVLVLLAVARLAGWLESVAAADVALAAVLFSVLTSRVFSGQYFIWLLGLGAVCLGDPRSRMGRAVGLLGISGLASHLVYPWLYSALLDGRPVAVIVQTIRVVALLAAAVVALRVLLRRAEPEAQLPAGPGSASP